MRMWAITLLFGVATLCAQGEIVTKTVDYESEGKTCKGFLAYDDQLTAKGKQPGVLVVQEWWGLNDFMRGRAEALAKLGYVAFAADMYGDGESTTDPARAKELASAFYGKPLMLERAQAGLDQLLKTGLVDGDKVAAIGFCFGGSAVQLLAYSGAPLKGIVSFHGGLVPANGDLGTKTQAKFLVLSGAEDPFNGPELRDAFTKALDEKKISYQFILYSDTKHAFMNPAADKVNLPGLGYNADTAEKAWQQMQVFFRDLWGEAKS
jgi:dienelactone hydrolase